ncbi:SGNH/GDSL hydrolase family protein [Methylobacterium sp. ID0610]|uniref:SGNH/GDSL hydrolase family protein n=1 Tax=Methylobacterium carpenticola TaxID=3344827 RepID=UPI0036CA6933
MRMAARLALCGGIVVLGAVALRAGAAHPPAGACDPHGVLLTTLPAPPPNIDAVRRHLATRALLPDQADTVLIGDSLVQGWPPALAEAAFGRVVNLGVNGDRTQNVLWRLGDLTPDRLRQLHPKRVLIIIGTNNLSSDSPCAVAAGIRAIIRQARSIWPGATVAWVEIPPRGAAFADFASKRDQVNAEIRATERTIDVDKAISCDRHQPCAHYRPDLLHWTRAGYEVLGAEAPKAFRALEAKR